MRKQGASFGSALAAIGVLIAAVPAALLPAFDDIYWQLAEGLTILDTRTIPTTATHAIRADSWIDHEWLFEAVAALAYKHHCYAALVVMCGLLAASIPALVYLGVHASSRNNILTINSDIAAGFTALLAGLASYMIAPVRPLEVGVAGFAALLLILRRAAYSESNSRWKWLPEVALSAMTLVWANVHASVILAPCVCALYAACAAFEQRMAAAVRYARYAVLAALFSTCSPFGYGIYKYAVAHTGLSDSTVYIREWGPFTFSTPLDWLTMGGTMLAVLFGWRKYTLLAERILALAFIALTLHQHRHIAFLIPACAVAIAAGVPLGSRSPWRSPWITPACLGLTIGTMLFLAPKYGQATPEQTEPGIAEAYAQLAHLPEPVNAFLDYDTAGYAELHNLPVRSLIDSRADCYSEDTWRDFIALHTLAPQWRDVLERQHIHAILIRNKMPLAGALQHPWFRLYKNETFSVYIDKTPEQYSQVIDLRDAQF